MHAEGDLRLELAHAALDGFAHAHHVAAGDCRDADTDRLLAVVADEVIGRLHVAAADFRNVAQANLLVGAATDENRLEILDRIGAAGRLDGDELAADADAPGVADEIALPQGVDDDLLGDAELRHAIPPELDVDRLAALAEGLDLGDVLHQGELAAHQVDELLELRVAVFVAVDGEEHAVHVAVVVDDE